MKLEEILFNNICQIPKFKPEDSVEQIRNQTQTIERFTVSGFIYRKRFEEKLASVCRSMHQYDQLKFIAGKIFLSIDSKLK